MRKAAPIFWFLLLLTGLFSLATALQPSAVGWSARGGADSLLKVVLGDGRRLFADMMFRKADIYFHSGYYPSIFDQAKRPKGSGHMSREDDGQDDHDEHADETPEEHAAHKDAADGHDAATEAAAAGDPGTNHVETAEEKHMREMDYLSGPRDWVDGFGRNFVISEHTHLEKGDEREILPWLRLTAELDPQKIETYTVAAYWLRARLNKPKEAEQFLREGLKANPNSYEICYELGQVYYDEKDFARARNLWNLGLRRWTEQDRAEKKPDPFVLEQITTRLAQVEQDSGNINRAIELLEIAKGVAPNPALLQQRIEALKSGATARAQGTKAP